MLPAINVEQDFNLATRARKYPRERHDGFWVVRQTGKFRSRKFSRESEQARLVWPNYGKGDEHVLGSGGCGHLRLRDGGALEFRDSLVELHACYLCHFVRFDVRAKPVCSA